MERSAPSPRGVISRVFEDVFHIRPDEFKLVQGFFLYFFLIGMGYTAGATAGETLFLARLGSEAAERLLPWVYMGVAVATVAITLLYDRLERRCSRIRLIVGAQAGLALSLLAFRAAVLTGHTAAYFGLAVWVEAVDLFGITLFFSYAGDFFTTRDARRLYGYITGGMAVGILSSGYLVGPIVSLVKTEGLLYLCAALQLGCAAVCLWISRVGVPLDHQDEDDEGSAVPLRCVFSSDFIRLAFVLVILCSVCTVMVDYEMKIVASRTMAEEAMAVWFAKFYGAMGVASFFVQFLLVGWLLNRFGIIRSLLVMPSLLILSSAAAAVRPTLLMAAASNFILLTFSETLELPAEELLFLPLHRRLRLRAQALLDGAVQPLGHGVGGMLLVALAALSVKVEQVALLVVASAVLWVVVILRVRPKYQQALEASLRRQVLGPVDLEALMSRPDSRVVARELMASGSAERQLAALDLLESRALGDCERDVAKLAACEHERVAVRALTLLAEHGTPDSLPAVRRALDAPPLAVRRASLLALCQLGGEEAFPDAARFLDAPEAPLRTAALLGLARRGGFDGALLAYPRLDAMLQSPEAPVRVEAARLLGNIGLRGTTRVLERLLADAAPEVRGEALAAAKALRNPALVPLIVAQLDDSRQRPLAMQALDVMPPDAVPELARALQHEDARYSRKGIIAHALGSIGGIEAARLLWGLIAPDKELDLRLAAARALRRLKAAQGLQGLALDGFDAILEALRGQAALLQEGRRQLDGASQAAVFLADHARLRLDLALSLLALRYDAQKLGRIEHHLFGPNEALRANALELLESMLPRPTAERLIPLVSGQARREADGPAPGLSAETAERLLRADAWTRAVVVFHMTRGGPPPAALGGRTMTDEDIRLHKVVTTVSFLKQVALFKSVPANFLASVASLMEERHLYAGETLFAEGDAGDSIYLICEGRVRIMAGGKEAAELGPRDHIGEMSLLDGQPRSATAVVAQDARLLRLGGESFRHLLVAHPGFAMALLESLAGRLREMTKDA
ncbi:MAG: MFS transporter [Elusimicrobia bacterium]|nr:MFS transporter [Elusimicrobiota bacterium]